MTNHLIFETVHWVVSHRRDARYPGYLMVSSRDQKDDLCDLGVDTLTELGPVLRRTEVLLRKAYNPHKVVFYKLGFSPGFSCHFHVAPVTLELLTEVACHPDYVDDPDGNDVILFLSRVYCERELSEAERADQRTTTEKLRALEFGLRPCNLMLMSE
jgi:diadenosine tetraphosphate (Ap4A) HIT family hydrolase